MGNKTIYVKDDELWERAKKLAGKDGMSGLITEALQAFLKRKEQEQQGWQTYRLGVGQGYNEDDGGELVWSGPTDYIAFEGRLLHSALFSKIDGAPREEKAAQVYQTKGGRLVLMVTDHPQSGEWRYCAYGSLVELRNDPIFADVGRSQRAEFFEALRTKLGDDWAVWID